MKKKKVKKYIKNEMRVAFTKLWAKKSVHKNKKKYTRKPKHVGSGIYVHMQFSNDKDNLVPGDTFNDADYGNMMWDGKKWINANPTEEGRKNIKKILGPDYLDGRHMPRGGIYVQGEEYDDD